MKKFLTLLLINLFFVGFLVAQSCQPDPMFADSSAGVYPPPFDAVESPEGGITDTACIGLAYEFNFTIVVSETIALFGATFELDSIRIDEVAGLPAGLGVPNSPFVICNPANCNFPSNSQGCASIQGTPTGGANDDGQSGAGDYDLVITGTVYIVGLPPQTITFPGLLAPGEYTLTLEEAGGNCTVGTDNILQDKIGIKAMPNPTTGATMIKINSEIDSKMQFTVTDLFGKVIRQESVNINLGQNQLELDASNLSNGIYIYSLSNELGNVSKKLVVQK
ncbi:MAG: hypothetical protein ACI9XO_003092 [Paraglaciecola sp.]|jgi:hypothetical protein